MAKKKAGIFDPWRQERPESVANLEPLRVNHHTEDGGAPQPVRFAGRRGGLTVWLTGANPDATARQAQTNVLAALLHLMADKKLHQLFLNWGVLNKDHTEGAQPRTVMSDGTRTVVVLGDYEKAIDAVTLALREAVRQDPKVGDYLLSLGIRPYIV
jgi:hypothetical protein